MKIFEITGHEPSLLPDGNWKLAWADEFDGTELDTTKWDYRTHIWGKRHPCFAEGGVELERGGNGERDYSYLSCRLAFAVIGKGKYRNRDKT